MVNPSYPESELTGKIIGCAMEVHNMLGNGFREVIYQRALALEMSLQGLNFVREQEYDAYEVRKKRKPATTRHHAIPSSSSP